MTLRRRRSSWRSARLCWRMTFSWWAVWMTLLTAPGSISLRHTAESTRGSGGGLFVWFLFFFWWNGEKMWKIWRKMIGLDWLIDWLGVFMLKKMGFFLHSAFRFWRRRCISTRTRPRNGSPTSFGMPDWTRRLMPLRCGFDWLVDWLMRLFRVLWPWWRINRWRGQVYWKNRRCGRKRGICLMKFTVHAWKDCVFFRFWVSLGGCCDFFFRRGKFSWEFLLFLLIKCWLKRRKRWLYAHSKWWIKSISGSVDERQVDFRRLVESIDWLIDWECPFFWSVFSSNMSSYLLYSSGLGALRGWTEGRWIWILVLFTVTGCFSFCEYVEVFMYGMLRLDVDSSFSILSVLCAFDCRFRGEFPCRNEFDERRNGVRLYCPAVLGHFLDRAGSHPRGAIFPTVD